MYKQEKEHWLLLRSKALDIIFISTCSLHNRCAIMNLLCGPNDRWSLHQPLYPEANSQFQCSLHKKPNEVQFSYHNLLGQEIPHSQFRESLHFCPPCLNSIEDNMGLPGQQASASAEYSNLENISIIAMKTEGLST